MSIVLPLFCLSHCIIHRKQKQGSSKLFLFLTLCLLFFIVTHSPNYRHHFRILLSCSSHQPHFLYPLMHCLYAKCPSLLCSSLSRAFFSWTCNCDPKLYPWTFQVCSLHLFVLNSVKRCLFCLLQLLQLLSFLGFGSSLIFAGSWLKIHEWTTY